jgi:hypothetical protein
MNIERDLILAILKNTDPFVEVEGELYKKFNSIKIEPVFETVITHKSLGLFRSVETEEHVYKGLLISLLYGNTVIKAFRKENIDLTNGDQLFLGGEIAGILRVEVSYDSPS